MAEKSSAIIPGVSIGSYTTSLSMKGMDELVRNHDPADPAKNLIWTTNPNVELPILLSKEGTGSLRPMTVMEMFKIVVQKYGTKPAIADKVKGEWKALSFVEYHDLIIKFALGLIHLGIPERSGVSILGFNCCRWFIDYFGAIFANCIAAGHYLTNTSEAVQFVAENSNTTFFAVENQEQLDKVLAAWDRLPKLK